MHTGVSVSSVYYCFLLPSFVKCAFGSVDLAKREIHQCFNSCGRGCIWNPAPVCTEASSNASYIDGKGGEHLFQCLTSDGW